MPYMPHLTVNGVLKNENEREVKAYFYILFFIDKIWRLVENVIGVKCQGGSCRAAPSTSQIQGFRLNRFYYKNKKSNFLD